jgi:hypothetical protein
MKAIVKKSGAAVVFGTVDPNALVASIVVNSVKLLKVKENKGKLDLSEGPIGKV